MGGFQTVLLFSLRSKRLLTQWVNQCSSDRGSRHSHYGLDGGPPVGDTHSQGCKSSTSPSSLPTSTKDNEHGKIQEDSMSPEP